MKKPSKKGIIFDVLYKSGRTDKFIAKNNKHYDQCVTDLESAVRIGAVVSWTENNAKVKEVKYNA